MAQACSHCGSTDVQTMVRSIHCLECNRYTSYSKLNETAQPTFRREEAE